MLAIIEGPDGSGKTTLIKALCEKYNFTQVSIVPRDWKRYYSHWDYIIRSYVDDHNYYVIDRSFISEWIYRVLKKDKAANITLNELSTLTYSKKLLFVFCNNENSYELSINRGENYITDKNEHDLLKIYYDFVKDTLQMFTIAKTLTYDFETKSTAKLYNEIKEVFND